jgi:hypothetical protein
LTKRIFTSLLVITSFLICKTSYGVQIVCDTDVSNSQNQLRIEPSDDIYTFSKIDLPGGFRLAGQYYPSRTKFKLYTYINSKDRYVLLSAQEFVVDPKACSRSFGDNRVYGEPYERDLFFSAIKFVKIDVKYEKIFDHPCFHLLYIGVLCPKSGY